MSATEPSSACLEFCFPTISGSPDVQTSSGELPLAQIKGPGNSALPFPQDGKEKAEPKVTQSLSPVLTVGMLRGVRHRWGRNLGEIGAAVGNSCQGNRAAVLCTPSPAGCKPFWRSQQWGTTESQHMVHAPAEQECGSLEKIMKKKRQC